MSRGISLRRALLDAQVVDAEHEPIGRVDDIELDVDGDRPVAISLLVGLEALADRLGRPTVAAAAARVRGTSGPPRIPASAVSATTPYVQLDVALEDLDDVAALERWLARHVISRLPGAGRARR